MRGCSCIVNVDRDLLKPLLDFCSLTRRICESPKGLSIGLKSNLSRHTAWPVIQFHRIWFPPCTIIPCRSGDTVVSRRSWTCYSVGFSAQPRKETFDLVLHQRKPCSFPHRNHAFAISSSLPFKLGSTGSTPVIAFNAQNQWSGSRSNARSNNGMASRPIPMIC